MKMRFKFLGVLLLLLGFLLVPLRSEENYQQKVEPLRRAGLKLVVYLLPEQLPQLPKAVRAYLTANQYLIPQVGKDIPNGATGNVIRGQFYQKGSDDWAVLASKNGVSGILVFREGKGKPDELAAFPDLDYMTYPRNDNLTETPRFSREIAPVEGEVIIGYYRAFGGPEPPAALEYQGISNCFLDECVSRIWYYYQGKWNWYQGRD